MEQELTKKKAIDQHSNQMIGEVMIQDIVLQQADKVLVEMCQLQDMELALVQDPTLQVQVLEIQADIMLNQVLDYRLVYHLVNQESEVDMEQPTDSSLVLALVAADTQLLDQT